MQVNDRKPLQLSSQELPVTLSASVSSLYSRFPQTAPHPTGDARVPQKDRSLFSTVYSVMSRKPTLYFTVLSVMGRRPTPFTE